MAVDGRGCWTSGQPKLNNPSCRGCGCRKRESACEATALQPASPAHPRSSSAPTAPHTPQHTALDSTKARACGSALCSLAPVLGRGLSTARRLQSCDPNPQPVMHHSSVPASLTLVCSLACQGESMSDVLLNSDFCVNCHLSFAAGGTG